MTELPKKLLKDMKYLLLPKNASLTTRKNRICFWKSIHTCAQHNKQTRDSGVVVRLSDLRLAVVGSNPGHGIACFSEVGDRFLRVNYLGCNHHLDQLSLASLRGR